MQIMALAIYFFIFINGVIAFRHNVQLDGVVGLSPSTAAAEPAVAAPLNQAAPSSSRTFLSGTGSLTPPGVVISAVLIPVLAALAIATSATMTKATKPRVLQAVSLAYILLNAVDNAIVVPGSYDLASALHVNVALSGAIYGVFQLGWAMGAMFARRTAGNWDQARIRRLVIVTFAAMGCADLVYGYLLSSGAVRNEWLAPILIALRFCTGMGSGYACLLHWMAVHVTKSSEQTSFALAYAVATNAGMICAPVILFAAVAPSIHSASTDRLARQQCAAPLFLVALLWIALGLVVALVTPRHLNRELAREDAGQDEQASQTRTTGKAQLPIDARRALIHLGWAIALERSCMVAGIELGTTMLLETHFGWPLQSVGAGLMAVGLCTIVVCCLGAAAKAAGYEPGSKVLLAASLVGVLSLGPLFDVKGAGPAAILAADALVYSTTFLTQGICDGIATNAAIDGERGYRMEDYQIGKVLGISLGRAWAAVFARVALESFGRNGYAGAQLLIGLLGFFTACRVASLVQNAEEGR